MPPETLLYTPPPAVPRYVTQGETGSTSTDSANCATPDFAEYQPTPPFVVSRRSPPSVTAKTLSRYCGTILSPIIVFAPSEPEGWKKLFGPKSVLNTAPPTLPKKAA